MRILLHYSELPEDLRGGVLVVGNFDGVHRGHRAVIATAADLARADGVPLGLLSFEPHPRQVFRPDDPPFRLTPMRAKARQLEGLGLDYLVIQRFDEPFRSKTAEAFIDEVLVGGLHARRVVAGQDFRFGRKRLGDLELIARNGQSRGLAVTAVDPVGSDTGIIHSSTRVREALAAGRPTEAAAMLGRPWEIEGRVEAGDRLARTIGFPTANLDLSDYLRPAFGVYAVQAGVDAGADTLWIPGVANLGRRPTVGGTLERLEVHLFDFSGDLYRRHLRVQLIEFLRPEQRFDGLEALKAQIRRDVEAARDVLGVGRPAT